MDFGNQTYFTEFILTGFSQDLQTRSFLFFILLFMYILIILGNGSLICIIITSPRMHTPMYYFLCNLSVLDLFLSSSSLPKMLQDVFSKRRRISSTWCLLQMRAGLFLGSTECLLLAVMAYDRYIAIRHPLHYIVIMDWKTCKFITVVMWIGSFILTSIPTLKPFVFCNGNLLDHFVCEILAVLELACGDLTYYKITIFVVTLCSVLGPVVLIVVSYICIIISILKIRSAGGRSKAFSTCASHLTVVFMFYGTIMTMYMGQSRRFSSSLKYIFLMYGVMTPVLNPLIYSLRNNDVKEAFKKILTKNVALWIV